MSLKYVTAVDAPLFRYIEPPYHQALMDHGEFLIGTLYKYKDTIQFNAHRGDNDEGCFTVYQTDDVFETAADISSEFKNHFGFIHMNKGAKNFRMINNKRIYTTENCLVISLSTLMNNSFMRRNFGEYCFWLTDLDRIAGCISESLQTIIRPLRLGIPMIGKIVYKSRQAHYLEGVKTAPVWVKEPDHSPQSEYRMIWRVDNPDLLKEHYIVRNTALRTLLIPPLLLRS